jgi:dolichol-phosphate mannosyltransferase
MGQSSPGTALLSVVIPTRNEAGNVGALVGRLGEVLAGVPVDLVFVDDSSDETPGLLRALALAPPPGMRIEVLHREPARQTGLGSAAAEGLKRATGSVVAVMDGDLQHPPELLTTMVRRLEQDDLDVVVASRYTRGGSSRGLNGPARVAVSWASKVVAQLLFREARKTSDPLSGYFVCRRAAIHGIEFRPIGFKILLEVLVCTASARVGDVPLTFAERHAGRSNASMAQGVAYLNHLWSLLLHVPGSARLWKYAMVGSSGLAIFLGILAAASALGAGPFLSWGLAFAVSLFLNWQLNRVLTFADVASPFTAGRGRPIYLPVALVGGVANLAVFMLLVLGPRLPAVLAGLFGALAAMALNFIVHRRILRRPPRLSSAPGASSHAIAGRVARQVPATVHLLEAPVDDLDLEALTTADGERPPRELLRALQTARPLMLAEAPSFKPQARTDIGVNAWMAIPVMEGQALVGLLVLHRQGRPFSGEELDIVLRGLRTQARSGAALITPLLASDKSPH